MVGHYCQKCHFVNNRSLLFFDYCQKRCFVKNKKAMIFSLLF
nr:MAG TPA: lipoprotein cytochrome c [Caudoviricetes sp.]